MKALRNSSIFFRDPVAIRLRPVSGGNAGGIEQVFCTPRDSMQRAAILASGDLLVCFFRLSQRQFAGERDHTMQLAVSLLQSLEIDLRQPLGGQLATLDP